MKKTKIIAFIVAMGLFFVSTGNAYASYTTIAESQNVVTVGHVRIQLNNVDQEGTEEAEKSKEEGTTAAGSVLPGEIIDKKVSITNVGTYSAYVRIYLEKYWEDSKGERSDHLDVNKIIVQPASADWIYNDLDGYYYYQKKLPPKEETSLLIDGFQVAEDIDTTIYAGYVGNMEVHGEAVQYDNFENSLIRNEKNEVIGWGQGLDFEDKQGNSQEQVNPLPDEEKDTVAKVSIKQTGEATISSTDLFPNFSGALPGDKIVQKIQIENDNRITKKIFLHAEQYNSYETEEQKQIAEALLREVSITVEQMENDGNNTIIYEGPLSGKNESGDIYDMVGEENRILLGEFPQGSSSKLLVTLQVPDNWDVDNSETIIKWIFSTIDVNQQTPLPTASTPHTEKPVQTPLESASPTFVVTIEPTKIPSDGITAKPTSKPIVTMSPAPTVVNTKGPLSDLEATPTPSPSDTKKPIVTPRPYIPPKTGDKQNFFFWCISSGGSLLIAIVMGINLLKGKKDKK